MKLQYPYANQADYVNELVAEFKVKYPSFSDEQLTTPITMVINKFNYKFNEADQYKGKILTIGLIKSLTTNNPAKIKPFSIMHDLQSMLKGDEDYISYNIGELKNIALPEDMTLYTQYLSEVSKRVIIEICATTEAKLPHTAKIEYQRWLSGAQENSNLNVNSSWADQIAAERTDKKRRTSPFVVTDEDSPPLKTQRVTFADTVGKSR